MTETFDMPTLLSELSRDEGRRLKPYLDTVGKTTIGVGRNLIDVGISDSECGLLLENDVTRSVAWLDHNLPWWCSLDAIRQRVIINIAFNMGCKLLTFVNTLAAMQRGDYAAAADGMLASKWAAQLMQLNEHEKNVLALAIIGTIIGLGKLLADGKRVRPRLVVGRVIIGAGLSMSAGSVLTAFPDLSLTGLVGTASLFGILGQNALEAVVQKFVGRWPGGKQD
ncbi:hypothetical protein DFQ28_001963 [Apophysomyces sp. BC1034]|nr:hypothetical protein DFQ30_010682 [Apophysomyces sp. BC1015]KAG0182596.1 hypothetical protein DFQ28_001963 [Apophysomyces sp. BC1034]